MLLLSKFTNYFFFPFYAHRVRKILSEQTDSSMSREKVVKVLEELQAQAEVGLCFVGVRH